MKTLIIFLIIISFLQSTILPINLSLIILICRSFIKLDKNNLYLAFFTGLLNSHLNVSTLGLESLIYLLAIQSTQIISKSNLANNPLLIVPISFVLLSFHEIFLSLKLGHSINFSQVFLGSLISLPIFYLERIWEERFIFKHEIKLRV